MTVLFFLFFLFIVVFIMSFESKQEGTEVSPIIEAKSLLSQGDEAGAFGVLKEGAENGDVMACFDCGFMMYQGIGCEKDRKRGLDLMNKGVKLEGRSSSMNWKSGGSTSELFEPQVMDLSCLFFLIKLVLNDHISS